MLRLTHEVFHSRKVRGIGILFLWCDYLFLWLYALLISLALASDRNYILNSRNINTYFQFLYVRPR
jgi:hypothetical protein